MTERFAVPQALIAPGCHVPTLVLGDNGFLRRYGSTMAIDEIVETMRYALSLASIGIGAGDTRVLRAAKRAEAPWILHHTDIRFLADGRRSHFGRSMATLHALLAREAPIFAAEDPLMGRFVASFRRFRPYTENTTFEPDYEQIETVNSTIREYRPEATSIGGDYLDVLLAVGDLDTAQLALEPILEQCRYSGSIPILTTYLAGVLRSNLPTIMPGFRAIMLPFNKNGVAMAPDRSAVMSSLARLSLPAIAMHVLGAGTITPEDALRHATSDPLITAAVVGASSRTHIDDLISKATLASKGKSNG